MKPILSICFFNYNDGKFLLPTILDILSVNDNRFQIIVQDNHSTDDYVNKIKNIKDERLIIRENKENLGFYKNIRLALSNNPSDYSLVCMVRDYIVPSQLSQFIDFLEQNKPGSGFVQLKNKYPSNKHQKFKAGEEAIKNTAYLFKHPSGYFWENNLLNKELCTDRYKNSEDNNDFPFELLMGGAAVSEDSYIYNLPMILMEDEKQGFKMTDKPKSKAYNQDNLWFMPNKRFDCFDKSLRHLLNLEIDIDIKKRLSENMLDKFIFFVSRGLYHTLRNKNACDHYGAIVRRVTLSEMSRNISNLLKIYTHITGFKVKAQKKQKYYLSLIKLMIKENKRYFFNPSR